MKGLYDMKSWYLVEFLDIMFGRHIIFCKIPPNILQIGQQIFLGANFRNMARMHNSTDYVAFLEKSVAPFLRNVSKTSFLGHFFCQNEAKYVKSQKSAWIVFLVLNVSYFVPSFEKIVCAVSKNEPGRTDGRRRFYRTLRFSNGNMGIVPKLAFIANYNHVNLKTE